GAVPGHVPGARSGARAAVDGEVHPGAPGLHRRRGPGVRRGAGEVRGTRMPPKVRFALVGAGAIAGSYARAFAGHPDAELVSVADVRFAAARELAASVG